MQAIVIESAMPVPEAEESTESYERTAAAGDLACRTPVEAQSCHLPIASRATRSRSPARTDATAAPVVVSVRGGRQPRRQPTADRARLSPSSERVAAISLARPPSGRGRRRAPRQSEGEGAEPPRTGSAPKSGKDRSRGSPTRPAG